MYRNNLMVDRLLGALLPNPNFIFLDTRGHAVGVMQSGTANTYYSRDGVWLRQQQPLEGHTVNKCIGAKKRELRRVRLTTKGG